MAGERIAVGYRRYVTLNGRNVLIGAVTSRRGDVTTIEIEQADIPNLIEALTLFAEPEYKTEMVKR